MKQVGQGGSLSFGHSFNYFSAPVGNVGIQKSPQQVTAPASSTVRSDPAVGGHAGFFDNIIVQKYLPNVKKTARCVSPAPQTFSRGEGGFKIDHTWAILKTDVECGQ